MGGSAPRSETGTDRQHNHPNGTSPLLRIHGYAASINVRKVLWACEEIGIPFEREDWAGGFRSTSDPAFLALNPVGLVPVIEDAGAVIWESNTIIRYLATSRNRLDLYPEDPVRRARIEMWMDWQASDFNNSWRYAFLGLVRQNPEYQDPGAIEKSSQLFSRLVQVIDAQLERTGGYIAGEAFTLADIPIGLSIHRWRSTPMSRPSLIHVGRYYAGLCERPGFQKYASDGGA